MTDSTAAEPGTPPVIGVIGGSGVYDIEGLTDAQWQAVEGPFGKPSDEFLVGTLDGQKVVFLPRHGRGHVLSPTEINARANIDSMKRLGVTEVISVSAVGSLKEELPPGTFVMVDQYIDRTFARAKTFFGKGLVGHVSVAEPVCGRLNGHLAAAAAALGIPHAVGGTYLAMEGPQFSSKAESALYRSWDCSVIGMTNMPEAKLAREAEICYGSVAMVTDYDCWHPGHDHVTVEQVIGVLLSNADKARALVRQVVPLLAERDVSCEKGCHNALDNAIITQPQARDPEMIAKLQAVAGRVL
ncbi:MAG: S-methyl-5'-thioadenosine phosphorylase [Pseudomonadota bacterium]